MADKYCCGRMRRQLTLRCGHAHSRQECPDVIVIRMANGEFAIPIKDGGSSGIVIVYCPWCGKEL